MADDFLALPEVAYLVDRLPVAALVLADTPLHRWFCAHARDVNMPLADQCRALGIPWHARKIGKDVVGPSALEAATILEPTVFVATWPAENHTVWAQRVCAAKLWPQSVLRWVAYHAAEMTEAEWNGSRTWLSGQEVIAKSTLVRTVVERAEAYNAEVERAENERRGQQLAPRGETTIEYSPIHNCYIYRDGSGVDTHISALDMALNPYLGGAAGDTAYRAARLLAMQAEAEQQRQYAQFAQAQNMYNNNLQAAGLLGLANQANALGNAPIRMTADYGILAPTDRSPIVYADDLLKPREYGSIAVKLLSTHDEFAQEGARMHHCVETYFPRAKAGLSHIVSLTRGKKKVATAEFDQGWQLVQAKGPTNAKVSDDPEIMGALELFGCEMRTPKGAELPKPKRPSLRERTTYLERATNSAPSDDGSPFAGLTRLLFGV